MLDGHERDALIQDSGKADGQIIAFANPVNSWWWLQFLWSFGGDLTDASGTPTVATPEAIAATDYYKKLLAVSPKSAISSNGDDATSLFITQNVGQMITYSGYWPTIMDPAQSKNLARSTLHRRSTPFRDGYRR